MTCPAHAPTLPAPDPDQEEILAFLTRIGAEKFADNFNSWVDLVTVRNRDLRKANMPVKMRKQLMREVEKWKQHNSYVAMGTHSDKQL